MNIPSLPSSFFQLFEFHDDDDNVCLSLPDIPVADVRMLLSVVYNGSIEASLEELRRVIFLARDLCVLIPVSAELLRSLEIDLPMPEYPEAPPPGHGALEVAPGHALQPSMPPLKIKSVISSASGNPPHHINFDAPPPPPPLKRVKVEPRHRPPPPPTVLFPALQPLAGGDALPMPSNCIKTSPDSFTCALCNATYGNLVSFRQHTKFHEDERDREQRNLMLNNMVSMCYSKPEQPPCLPSANSNNNFPLRCRSLCLRLHLRVLPFDLLPPRQLQAAPGQAREGDRMRVGRLQCRLPRPLE